MPVSYFLSALPSGRKHIERAQCCFFFMVSFWKQILMLWLVVIDTCIVRIFSFPLAQDLKKHAHSTYGTRSPENLMFVVSKIWPNDSVTYHPSIVLLVFIHHSSILCENYWAFWSLSIVWHLRGQANINISLDTRHLMGTDSFLFPL